LSGYLSPLILLSAGREGKIDERIGNAGFPIRSGMTVGIPLTIVLSRKGRGKGKHDIMVKQACY